jgi:hypothetical protein
MAPARLSFPSDASTPAKPKVSSDDVGTQQDCSTDKRKMATYLEVVTKPVGLSKAKK